MFDRCDADTTTILDAALEESRRLGHNYLGTEHLLVALARNRHLLPGGVASRLPDEGVLYAALIQALGEPPRSDHELLEVVGVDLDAVRSAVRHTFGVDAVERLCRRRVHQPWQPWRRPSRRCTSLLAGNMSVAPRVKQALVLARDEAVRRQQVAIDPAALLAGMIDTPGTLSTHLLRCVGADLDELRRRLCGPG